MDGMLSQEEINALLSGVEMPDENATQGSETTENDSESLTDMEKDTVGEISNISMGTAATTLSSLLNQKVNISTPVVSYAEWDDMLHDYDKPCVFLQLSYKEGLHGNNILVLNQSDVKVITDLMMGGDGTNIDEELGELHLSAIGEAMNQMMGSASTSLSAMLEMKIDIHPPKASIVDLNDTLDKEHMEEFISERFLKISFRLTIGDLVDSQIMQLYPIEFAKRLCKTFDKDEPDKQEETKQVDEPPKEAQAPVQPEQAVQANQNQQQVNPMMGQQMNQMMGQQMNPMMGQNMNPMMGQQVNQMMGQNMNQMMGQDVNVQSAQFQPFASDIMAVSQKENINLIMDVPLEVTAELGRTSKSIQDILEFTPGTIIELDKIAGEPIDVLVNGKFVAKGEVVVIEESFGVRITEIVE